VIPNVCSEYSEQN